MYGGVWCFEFNPQVRIEIRIVAIRRAQVSVMLSPLTVASGPIRADPARGVRSPLAAIVGVVGFCWLCAEACAQCTEGPCGSGFIGPGPGCATTTYTCTNRYISFTMAEGPPGSPVIRESLTCDACGTDQDQKAGPIGVSVTKGLKVCVSVGAEIEFGDPLGLYELKLTTSTELCIDTQETFMYEHEVNCRARTRVRGDVLEIPTPVTLTVQFEELLTVKTLPLNGDPCGIGQGSSIQLACRQYEVTSTSVKRHITQRFVDEPCPPVTPTACVETQTLYPHQDIEDAGGGLYIWVPSDVIRCP